MAQENNQPNIMQYRNLLMGFYSSEINSHARLIIGFVVILFTIIQVTITLLNPQNGKPLTEIQRGLSFVGISVVSYFFYFSLMRNIAYGTLANTVVHTNIEENVNEEFYLNQILVRAEASPMLRYIPMRYFVSRGQGGLFSWNRCKGGLICMGLALITALTLSTLIGLYSLF